MCRWLIFESFCSMSGSISHHKNEPDMLQKLSKINHLHISLFSYFVDKLRATPDGDGTLLDHAMIVYGGGMSDSTLHQHSTLPTLLVGGGAGRLKGGVHRQYDKEVPMANLLVALLDKLDV